MKTMRGYCANDRERGGKKELSLKASSIADHQLHNMETNGIGQEMTGNQVSRAHVATVTVTMVTGCTVVKCGEGCRNSPKTNNNGGTMQKR